MKSNLFCPLFGQLAVEKVMIVAYNYRPHFATTQWKQTNKICCLQFSSFKQNLTELFLEGVLWVCHILVLKNLKTFWEYLISQRASIEDEGWAGELLKKFFCQKIYNLELFTLRT